MENTCKIGDVVEVGWNSFKWTVERIFEYKGKLRAELKHIFGKRPLYRAGWNENNRWDRKIIVGYEDSILKSSSWLDELK